MVVATDATPATPAGLARRHATVRTDHRGTRIYRSKSTRPRRIDLAVCAIMAHSVAATVEPLYWYDA